jgi:hypothetical protein
LLRFRRGNFPGFSELSKYDSAFIIYKGMGFAELTILDKSILAIPNGYNGYIGQATEFN